MPTVRGTRIAPDPTDPNLALTRRVEATASDLNAAEAAIDDVGDDITALQAAVDALEAAPDPVLTVNGVGPTAGAVTLDTGDISEGSRLYYTNARARAAVTGDLPVQVDAATGVISLRRQAWLAPVGDSNRAPFNPATVTLEQLAERVAALIEDFRADRVPGA